jgi:hypothetical protein
MCTPPLNAFRISMKGLPFCIALVAVMAGMELFEASVARGQDEELSKKEKMALKSFVSDVDEVTELLEKNRGPQSLKSYQSAIRKLQALIKGATPPMLRELEQPLAELAEGRKKLVDLGASLAELPALEMADENGESISFKNQIAPILVAKCGNCHVSATRGDFGMNTFAALASSGAVVPRDPVSSRLIQVIDSGEMPRGGGMVTEQELALLQQWVTLGAKNDGEDDVPLNRLTADNAAPPMNRGAPPVSFECKGCHIDATQPRGGLNMTNLAALLRGGDSGVMLNLQQPEESLLVKKLKGTADGNRMPGGRPPLNAEIIATIQKWIAEGARFDEGEAGSETQRVAAVAKARSLNHASLAEERLKLGHANWKRALPGIEPNLFSTDDLQVFATLKPDALAEFGAQANSLVTKIKDEWKIDSGDPLNKGKVTLFLFDRRYDFNEMGLMVEGHAMPKEMMLNWKFDSVDASLALLVDRSLTPELMELELTRGLAALATAGSANDIPRWFADGMGYSLAAKLYPKVDLVQQWQQGALAAVDSEKKNADFLQGTLSETQAGLAGYYFIARLELTPGFKRLLNEVKNGQGFEASFAKIYGEPSSEYLKYKRPPANKR